MSEAVSTGLPPELSSSAPVEKVTIEHGPRTPSEPPDDDDDDEVISPLVSPKDVPPPPPPPPPPLNFRGLPLQDPRLTGVHPAMFGSSRAFAELGPDFQSRRAEDSFLPSRRTCVSTSIFESYDRIKNNQPPSPPPLPSWSEHSCKSSELSSRLSPQSVECTKNSVTRSSTTSDSLSTILKRDQEIRVWQETHSLRRNFTPPPSTSHHRPYPHEQRSLRNSTSSLEANRHSVQSLRHHSQPQLLHYPQHHPHTGLHLDSQHHHHQQQQRKETFSGSWIGSHRSDSSGPSHSPKPPAYNSSCSLSTDNIENVQAALRRHRDHLRAQLDLTLGSTSVVTTTATGSAGLTAKGRLSTSSVHQSGDRILEQARFRNDVVPNGGLPLLGPYSRDIFVPRHAVSINRDASNPVTSEGMWALITGKFPTSYALFTSFRLKLLSPLALIR
ncbi:unnamed protein product [Dibothriocephalus latus]|uniref:Uncharacterized protein n=1 Tax=Dibothriocephalus latus TaxID=60516 RepID=A0A3P7L0D5_DIBLA|nr:unnamed protein product [Dibothriocephalus latus]